jgi:nucleoid-associated protein YgaU
MKLTPWLVLMCLGLAACSGSKSAKKVNEVTPQIELSDADEFIDSPTADTSSEDPVITDSDDDVMINESNSSSTVTNYAAASGAEKQYTVQKNETLMLIAFKLYGDYEKWKELANYNRGILKGSTQISQGMVLRYLSPVEEFIWNPQGLPYLIRTGDTLGKISNNVYNTMKKWKLLWENNRPLIKDPNKIYAGFTLYYIENGREVASEI